MTELAQDSRGNSFGAGVARLERASKPKSKAKEALDIKELALKGIALTNADDNLNQARLRLSYLTLTST